VEVEVFRTQRRCWAMEGPRSRTGGLGGFRLLSRPVCPVRLPLDLDDRGAIDDAIQGRK
jgi:hypothetical protein